jgi:serine/threonine protein kinase
VVNPQDSSDGGAQLLLGKKLLEKGLITPDQLREALVERARHVAQGDRNATPLGGILVAKGFLSDVQLLEALNEQGGGNGSISIPAPSASTLLPAGLTAPNAGPGVSAVSLPPIEAPQPTQTRLGKYVIQGELGRGGMGVVYEALDSQLNRKVALKLMLANPNMDPRDRQLELDRFIQEAQLSAKLKHPNIVTVYEAGVLDGRQFLAMELIEGTSFSDWRHGASLRDQVAVIRDVALAVHHAHEQGILHRDLKPRNILVGPGPRPCVTDFGLAKSLGKNVNLSLTGSGAVVGTPAYMSPEQAQGLERVDWRTDIYSLGVILYEVMTGRTPFTGESPIEILMKVVKDPVVPPLQAADSAAAIGLDKTIENICLKALARKDKDRYVTAQAFADDLAKWLAGEQVKVSAPKVRRGIPNLKVYALLTLFLAGLAGVLVWLANRPGKLNIHDELTRGRDLMVAGKFEDALLAYQAALIKDPDSEEARQGEAEARKGADEIRRKRDADQRRTLDETVRKLEQTLHEVTVKTTESEAARSEAEKAKFEQQRREALERLRLLQEEADRAKRLLGISTPSAAVSSSSAPDSAWRNAHNLLPLVDPYRHSVWGAWALQNGRLVSDRTPNARIEIPVLPPEEYDLRVGFTRTGGTGSVALILVGLGRTFGWEVGQEDAADAGFFRFAEGKEGARVAHGGLQNDRHTSVEIQVRRDGVRAFLEGKDLSRVKTDYSDVALPPEWKLRNFGVLGLGSSGSPTLFHRVELLEITGKHRRPLPVPPLPLKATSVPPGSVKNGLIGEYYFGTRKGLTAVRRIDPKLTFDWKEQPAWKDGPRDGISAKWTGFLHVPKGGRYAFMLRTDDDARVVLDDVQLFGLQASAGSKVAPVLVQLDEGFHRLLVEWSDTAYLAGLSLLWSEGGEASPVPVPDKAFFHNPLDFRPASTTRVAEFAGEVAAHSNSVSSVAFRPDSAVFATASDDRRVKFWDVPTRKDMGKPMVHPSGVISVAWSPDGKTVATGAWDNRVRLWDTAAGTELRILEGHAAFVQSVCFSPDGKLLASAGYDSTVRLWDLETSQPSKVLKGHTSGVEAVAFSPDGKLLASAGLDHVVRLWDPAEGTVVRSLTGHVDGVSGLAWSPDGKRLATAGWDDTLRFWDAASGRLERKVQAHGAETLSVAWSPDGKLVATGGADALVKLWHSESGAELRVYPGHAGRVISLSFSPDGALLASAGFDGTVRLWNVAR